MFRLSKNRSLLTRSQWYRNFCQENNKEGGNVIIPKKTPLLKTLPSQEEVYAEWDKTWESLAYLKKPLHDIMFERYRKRIKDDQPDDYRRYAELPRPPIAPKTNVSVSNISLGKGRRKKSYATAYILPLEENEEVTKFINNGVMESWCWNNYKLHDDRFFVNGRRFHEYFSQGEHYLKRVFEPLAAVDMLDKCLVICSVRGGGFLGQSDATRAAISWAITHHEKSLKSILQGVQLLKSDRRQVERKKYGRPKARKGFTWVKR